MNIADKTLQLKKDFNDVYKAGQSSMVDESKIIEKTVSGEYISVDDVSEIPHEVKVKLTSGGGSNLVNVEAMVNTNLVKNSDGSFTITKTSDDKRISKTVPIHIPPQTKVLCKFETLEDTSEYGLCFGFNCADGTTLYRGGEHQYGEFTHTKEIVSFYVYLRGSEEIDGGHCTFKNLQVNIETIKPYEPYKETLTDYSGVSLTRCGGNLWKNGDRTFIQMSESMPVKLLAGITYTFSADVTTTDTDYGYCLVYDATNNIVLGYLLLDGVKSITFTPIANIEHIWLYASRTRAAGEGDTATFKNIMLNEGSTALPYEPYNAQTLTANADGTVEGVKITSPYMYITTDNKNVTINATYHKSYGMQTEYDRFWESFQDFGHRTDYTNAFSGIGWVNEIFKPKYPIDSPLKYNQLFRFAFITQINYDLNLTKMTNANLVFDSCTKLVKIQKIITNENVTYTQWFGGCIALETIAFDGTIGKSINFQYSTKLSKSSILNIFSVLSSTVAGQTLTLSKTAVTNAFGSTTATEWTNLVATKTNWTISLV